MSVTPSQEHSAAISSKGVSGLKDFSGQEDKTEEALRSFIVLDDCKYASKNIGNAKNNEFMECDCYEEFEDGRNKACSEYSDCINRLTLIECVNGLCNTCGDNCENQKFQKKEYADISIFKTELKGYGVRANSDLEENQFIYEYKGEVIEENEFRERLIEYDQRGFKHFYFMMLQSGEFIDATIKGALARFCNHSCNPNAYVNKWEVAGKLRMGIFAKRRISKGEEITFDYNVDRYGATAQKCYCGESNCIGYMGGKTQTDSASLLPKNYADALGVQIFDGEKWIKEMKAQGIKIEKQVANNINMDFVESLELSACFSMDEVAKVMSVLLQIDNEYIGKKLLGRLFDILDETLLTQVIKFHGYSCFAKLLKVYIKDIELVAQILEFLLRLPKSTKNGITSSQIDKEISKIISAEPELSKIGNELLEKWNSYETYNRISKKEFNDSNKGGMIDLRRIKLPHGWEIIHENGRPMYYNAQLKTKLHNPPNSTSNIFKVHSNPNVNKLANRSYNNLHNSPSGSDNRLNKRVKRNWVPDEEYEVKKKLRIEQEQKALDEAKLQEEILLKEKFEQETRMRDDLAKIIEEANNQKQLAAMKDMEVTMQGEEKKKKKISKNKQEVLEHKWNKYFATFVPNILKKYKDQHNLSHDHIKNCARDIVKTLTAKELKKNADKTPPEKPSSEKLAKVKSFVKGYMEKFIIKYNEKKRSKTV
ncbi:hypothetical protein TPHA_0A02720 [Tetrapisispora phaffii CBS 4417]|uniref:Histone-lysine N-methyltransferase, H3 lysine-36 specific n=1 Tax=Tetrapisispora phaffii (strain ATCC 24235 / CBS 4417 / NBRC 1672 / NRRL Y-8282 / UCD 70-5) TaxID=1071381 RepID=G8BN76_TETPH|nr:hypothetical protein TPHA_0A02720 [Tetrapisispora phaffii CBS 4417]CCE61354.1 hypothetical protein TPHA_0A02720 [Tetrapisispora phaffii CBS 4417]